MAPPAGLRNQGLRYYSQKSNFNPPQTETNLLRKFVWLVAMKKTNKKADRISDLLFVGSPCWA